MSECTNAIECCDDQMVVPIVTDTSIDNSGSVLSWDGTGSKPTITGAGLLIGTAGSNVDGQIWKKTSSGTNNTDWNPL